MDGAAFDRVARTFGRSGSRRAVAALTAATLARWATPGAVAADEPCERDAECRPRERCCGGRCRDVDEDRDHCGSCGNRCGPREKCCNGRCRDLISDPDNCGRCGRRCAGNEPRCVEGKCGLDPCFRQCRGDEFFPGCLRRCLAESD